MDKEKAQKATDKVVVIATPHSRNDSIECEVRRKLPKVTILRIRDHKELVPSTLNTIRPSWVFFPHWSRVIPDEIHKNYRCVVFHMTDLPYGRGGSPLQNLVVRGHKQTILSALHCVSEMDAGPVYLKSPLSLKGTAEEILRRASSLMPQMITNIVTHSIEPTPQEGELVVFKRRKPEEGKISNLNNPEQIYNHIRMLDGEGYPPAFVELGNLRIEFTSASLGGGCVNTLAKIITIK
jgi:methionyl-tRNA formyltransferase